jgi:hypothetical protein
MSLNAYIEHILREYIQNQEDQNKQDSQEILVA